MDGLRPRRAHVGRGVVQRLRLAPVRSDAGPRARSRGRTRPLRRGSTRAEPPECSSTSASARADGGLLRFELGESRTRGADAEHAGRARRHGTGANARQGDEAWAGRRRLRRAGARSESRSSSCSPSSACAEAGTSRSDPRRIAAACRRELVEFLRDQRIDVPPSVGHARARRAPRTPRGRRRDRASPTRSGARATGRSRGRERPRREARRELKAVRRGLRRALPPGRRFRGLFSLRSLLAELVEAIVMAAGEGRRLRPITERWPKPILPIDGRAVIATLVRQLGRPKGSGRSRS